MPRHGLPVPLAGRPVRRVVSRSAAKLRDSLIHAAAKELRHHVKRALHQGWTLEKGGRHTLLVSPDGECREPVPTSSNGGLHRKFLKVLRDHGYKTTG